MLKSSKVYFIKRNKLKIAYKIISFRSSPPEVLSMEDAPRNEVNAQENTNTEARSQQSRFGTWQLYICILTLSAFFINVKYI